jgi:hypothetical protein
VPNHSVPFRAPGRPAALHPPFLDFVCRQRASHTPRQPRPGMAESAATPSQAVGPAGGPAGSTQEDDAAAKRGGTPDLEMSSGSSGWASARRVVAAVRASHRFHTLRDLISADCFIDSQRLTFREALGEGAFAEVQLAELRPSGGLPAAPVAGGDTCTAASLGPPRLVAVKRLRQELVGDSKHAELFVREVTLLRKLRHR